LSSSDLRGPQGPIYIQNNHPKSKYSCLAKRSTI